MARNITNRSTGGLGAVGPNVNLDVRRNQLFANYERGLVTESEVHRGYVAIMLDAADDDAALHLCDSVPAWFRASFQLWLIEIALNDYYARWFGIEDTRRPEQVEADARRQQSFLKRTGDQLKIRLAKKP